MKPSGNRFFATVAFLVFLIAAPLSLRGQEIAKALDSDTAALFVIDQPDRFFAKCEETLFPNEDTFDEISDLLDGLLRDEANREESARRDVEGELISNGQFATLEELEQLVVVVHDFDEEELKLSIVLEFSDNTKFSEESEGQLKAINAWFARQVDMLTRIGIDEEITSFKAEAQSQWLVIGNSVEFSREFLKHVSNGSSPRYSLDRERNFKQAQQMLASTGEKFDATVYVKPEHWMNTLTNTGWISESRWRAQALSEISLLCGGLQIAPEDGGDLRVGLVGFAAFTNPRSGVGKLFDIYRPVEEFPPIIENPHSLNILNREPDLFDQQNRKLFDAEYGEGAFESLIQALPNGLLDQNGSAFAGTRLDCWYQQNEHHLAYVGYRRLVEDLDEEELVKRDTRSHLAFQLYALRTDDLPKESTLDGYPAWFGAQDRLTERFLRQRPYLSKEDLSESFQIPNPGAMIWEGWQIFGDKRFLEGLANFELGETSPTPNASAGVMYNELADRYEAFEKPFLIQARWKPHWASESSRLLADIIMSVFENPSPAIKRYLYANKEPVDADDKNTERYQLLDLFELASKSILSEAGQSTLMLSRTRNGNLKFVFGLFTPDDDESNERSSN